MKTFGQFLIVLGILSVFAAIISVASNDKLMDEYKAANNGYFSSLGSELSGQNNRIREARHKNREFGSNALWGGGIAIIVGIVSFLVAPKKHED